MVLNIDYIVTELHVPKELLERKDPSTLTVLCSPPYQPRIASRCHKAAAHVVVQQQEHSSSSTEATEKAASANAGFATG